MEKPKPRVIKSYDKIDTSLRKLIKQTYPDGYEEQLITFTDQEGRLYSALPFETDDFKYLIKFSMEKSTTKSNDDDDDDDMGDDMPDDSDVKEEELKEEELEGEEL